MFPADFSDYSRDNTGRVRPVWSAALYHLSRAKRDKLPASSLCAHDAMRQLVHAVGIIAGLGGAQICWATESALLRRQPAGVKRLRAQKRLRPQWVQLAAAAE